MKIFIFENVGQLTSNFFNGGGLVIIAKDKRDAKKQIIEANEDSKLPFMERKYSHYANNIELTDKDWGNVKTYGLVDEPERAIFVFPDAGGS